MSNGTKAKALDKNNLKSNIQIKVMKLTYILNSWNKRLHKKN